MDSIKKNTQEDLIRAVPKVELHVHLEGAIQAHTLFNLAKKNHIPLPVDNLINLRRWYQFLDFSDFNEKYILISNCIQSIEDIYLIGKEFLEGQAAQNTVYTEATYTAYTHYKQWRITMQEQIIALMEASKWAEQNLGVRMRLIIDIARETTPEEGMLVARAAVEGMEHGVVALGLGGYEVGHPPHKFEKAFAIAKEADLACVLHAGELSGPESIWEALEVADSVRIGHGVRCVEDPALVDFLREKQIPLEVCPSSNVCLGVVSDYQNHPITDLLKEGLNVTVNSDDPALFSTTLVTEYLKLQNVLGYDNATISQLIKNGIRASFLNENEKMLLLSQVCQY